MEASDMVKLTINGKGVEVPEGTTVIEAYKMLKEDIAHYCWHPGLSVAGVCRLCMVEIEGQSKPQVACNTLVQEGMVVRNDSEMIQKTVRWGLDFHLINHPLDCPICDQAGECGLQEQYMKFGQYDPEMSQPKVKKRKVVDLGERVVLDSERCILCSRCVRFTDEVSKTHELGIFQRGDRSQVGTVGDRPLNNKYSLNTVDICPVGALTSKDFRFRQRVWYLKNKKSICTGCSTGCNTSVYYNEEGVFRVKPQWNEKVNGHWMCDDGRDLYKLVNRDVRLVKAQVSYGEGWKEESPLVALKQISQELREQIQDCGASSVAVVLTGQNTTEEYTDFVSQLKAQGVENFFHWINNEKTFDDFDELLIRGDKNPNTKGLLQTLEKAGVESDWKTFDHQVGKSIQFVIVVGPEHQNVYPELEEMVNRVTRAKKVVWLSPHAVEALAPEMAKTVVIPMKTAIEKSGSFINHQGLKQNFGKVVTLVPEAFTLQDIAAYFQGAETGFNKGQAESEMPSLKRNYFSSKRGSL